MTKPRSVDIYVEPDSNEPSGYCFSMEDGGRAASALVFDKNADKMKKSDDYKISFKLYNRKGADLVFSKLPEKVMWAMATDGPTGACPPEGSTFDGFYVDPATYIKDDLLTVINTDQTCQFFSFCLNFVPRGTKEGKGTKYICYDPIGDNRNGGSVGGIRFLSTTTLIVAIAVVAIIAFAAYELGVFGR